MYAPSVKAAGGTITIDQSGNPSTLLGTWSLVGPTEKVFTNAKSQITTTIDSPEAGYYTFAVRSPESAETIIRLYQGSSLIHTEYGNKVQFDYQVGAMLRIHVEYRFTGVVSVTSNPEGVSFELKGPGGMRYTGITPAEFTEMPPVYYSVRYSNVEDCVPARPQRRNLTVGAPLTFQNNFLCEGDYIPIPPPPAPYIPEFPGVTVSQAMTQYEVLPGGKIRSTVTVKNNSTSTMRNLELTVQYNPELAFVIQPVSKSTAKGGQVSGNIIAWYVPDLYAGQTWNVVYEMQVKYDVAVGDILLMMARVSGNEIDPFAENNLQDTDEVGVTDLPQTGMSPEMIFLGATLLGSLALTQRTRRKKYVALTV